MLKTIVNKTINDIELYDVGITVPGSGTYTLDPQEFERWASSSDIVNSIVAGDLVVNDGEDDLPMRVGIGLIQDNQVVLNEYYTLVCDDSVLIGEGKILYYNDNFPLTGNVPGYMDEPTEDDVPTENVGDY